MDEQNRLRLARIADRHAKRSAEGPRVRSDPTRESRPSAEEEFRAAFVQAREDLLRPAMSAVAEELALAGYKSRITPGGTQARPAIDLHVELPDARSKDVVRFFPFLDPERGWQIVAELELKGKPFELSRFARFDELRRDVLEHVIIDAIEQMFSSKESRVAAPEPSSRRESQAPDSPTSGPIAGSGVGPRSDERGARTRVGAIPREAVAVELQPSRARSGTSGGTDRGDARALRGALAFPEAGDRAARFDGQSGNEARTRTASGADSVGSASSAGPSPTELGGHAVPVPAVGASPLAEVPPRDRVPETQEVDVRAFRGALPFKKGAPAPAFFAAAEATRTSDAPDVGATGEETMPLVALSAGDGPELPFANTGEGEAESNGRSGGVSALSLEQYATFRARLAVEGEDSADVWRDFGITSRADKEALQARFAAHFRGDPGAQAWFVERLRLTVSKLRGPGGGA
jgi:hypothetical protein